MGLSEQPDSRPVGVGDLVAAQWFSDPSYYIGEVRYDNLIPNPGGVGSVEDAHHMVKLMDANEWRILVSDMSQAAFGPVVSKFPMITTGDFDPGSTFKLEADLKEAVLMWLNWNYPK